MKCPELTFPSQFSFVDLDSKAALADIHPVQIVKFFVMYFGSSSAVGSAEKKCCCVGYEFEYGQEAAIVSS